MLWLIQAEDISLSSGHTFEQKQGTGILLNLIWTNLELMLYDFINPNKFSLKIKIVIKH